MKFNNENQIKEFIEAVSRSKGNVFLHSNEGDSFNLKSPLCRFVAIGQLLGEHGDELELFCDTKEDEALFYKFFRENPEVL